MTLLRKSKIALALAACLMALPAAAGASETKSAENIEYSFEGAFGTFDRAQLQRGFLVYKEVCSSCHGLKLVAYRNLSEPGGPEFPVAAMKAIAADAEVRDGPNGDGEMFDRPGKPSDRFVSPFPNENAARASNGGALPPDLSLITKSRDGFHYPWYVSPFIKMFTGNGGPEYVYAVLTGYGETPHLKEGEEAPEGKHFNPYFASGNWISMPPPLNEDAVEFSDGTKATVEQMALDVSAFLAWTAEPKLEARKQLGFKVLIFLLIFAALMFLSKRALWSRVPH